jgi:hypothetical protein
MLSILDACHEHVAVTIFIKGTNKEKVLMKNGRSTFVGQGKLDLGLIPADRLGCLLLKTFFGIY